MGAYKDAHSDLTYDSMWQTETRRKKESARYHRQKIIENVAYNSVFIYSLNWLIIIQGHRRAETISQHALREKAGKHPGHITSLSQGKQRNTRTTLHLWEFRALKIDLQLRVFGLREEARALRGNRTHTGRTCNVHTQRRHQVPSGYEATSPNRWNITPSI